MRSIAIVTIATLILGAAASEGPKPELETFTAEHGGARFTLTYPVALGKRVDHERLLKSFNPLYKDSGFSERVLLESRVTPDAKERYRIAVNTDPSFDPSFTFYLLDAEGKQKDHWHIWGLRLKIPGDGSIIVSGHTNTMFDTTKRFLFKDGEWQEVPQPFHYAGLKTRTRQEITLYSDKELKHQSMTLPPGAEIEVLVGDCNEDLLLVRTAERLVGWVDISPVQQEDTLIEGIFFFGD